MPQIKQYKDWLFVEVETGSTDIQLHRHHTPLINMSELTYYVKEYGVKHILLEPGRYFSPVHLRDVSEELAREVVYQIIDAVQCLAGWVDYEKGQRVNGQWYDVFYTALESLHSLVRSLGFEEVNNVVMIKIENV